MLTAINQEVKDLSVTEIQAIISEAMTAARTAAEAYENTHFPNGGWGACGFAWVNIYNIKGNTRLGKRMTTAGVRQDHTRAYQIWNPSCYPTQNVDTLEAGARAAAKVLTSYGFTAYAGSRLD